MSRPIVPMFVALSFGVLLACAAQPEASTAPRTAPSATEPASAPPCPPVPTVSSEPKALPELSSWRPGPARQRIEAFVAEVTDPKRPGFVPAASRIAVFDNDGTLWSEQPVYFQVLFAVDYVAAQLPEKPPWASRPWARSLAKDGHAALARFQQKDLLEIVAASQAGATVDEYAARVRSWLENARHPRFDKPYTELVFQPMLELLAYLRAHGFSTHIVSGGDMTFMRVFAEAVYGVPPENVTGSTLGLRYEVQEGSGTLRFEARSGILDDGPEKPVNIQRQIGKTPIFAAGNSDGDRQMLELTTLGRPGTLALLVHHDDAVREWTYDRGSPIGKLEKALDEAPTAGWLVVSMKNDFSRIYPFESP